MSKYSQPLGTILDVNGEYGEAFYSTLSTALCSVSSLWHCGNDTGGYFAEILLPLTENKFGKNNEHYIFVTASTFVDFMEPKNGKLVFRIETDIVVEFSTDLYYALEEDKEMLDVLGVLDASSYEFDDMFNRVYYKHVEEYFMDVDLQKPIADVASELVEHTGDLVNEYYTDARDDLITPISKLAQSMDINETQFTVDGIDVTFSVFEKRGKFEGMWFDRLSYSDDYILSAQNVEDAKSELLYIYSEYMSED